jgi:alpha-ketoglutarate-dependent taurine dioxygenase
VRVHPETGERVLRVNQSFASRIDGAPPSVNG